MSPRFTPLLAAPLTVLVAPFRPLNAEPLSEVLGGDWARDLPVLVLVIAAFAAGAVIVAALGAFRNLVRAIRHYRRGQHGRRDQAAGEISGRAAEAELAGRLDEARRAYDEVLRRDPAHAEASMRLGALARRRGDAAAALEYDLRALADGERGSTLLAVAEDYRGLGRFDDAMATYRRILGRDPDHVAAWRGLRDLAVERGRWAEALDAQERLCRRATREDRAAEDAWRTGLEYELGQALAASGDTAGATERFRSVLRARPDFVPAALALGDVLLRAGETKEAARVWERALHAAPASPILSRIERLFRAEGRPARMVQLYEDAARRHPDNLAIAFGLGRVYFELAMLDEAAEQFQKLEVRAPDATLARAYLGAIFERHGQSRAAFEEYRRALRFPESSTWPHRCAACGTAQPAWFDRCPACRRWNTSLP